MPAAKTESAEAVRRAFIASVISHVPMFWRACTVRARKASALRRIGVVTVAVPLADSAVPSVDEGLRTGCGKISRPRSIASRWVPWIEESRYPPSGFTAHPPSRGPHAGYDLWSFHFSMLPAGHAYVAGWPRLCCRLATPISRSAKERSTGANGMQHRRVTDFRRPAERCRRAKDRRWQRQGFRA